VELSDSTDAGQLPAQSKPPAHPYTRLGGWLMFIVLVTAISVASSIVNWVESFETLVAVSGLGRAEFMFKSGPAWIAFSIFTMLSLLASIVFLVQTIRRNPHFFLVFHIRFAFGIVAQILALIFINSASQGQPNYLVNILLGTFVTVMWSLYYVKSKRVATYMGSYEYLRRNPITKRLNIATGDRYVENTLPNVGEDISRIGWCEMNKTVFRNIVMVIFAVALVVLIVEDSVDRVAHHRITMEFNNNRAVLRGLSTDLDARTYQSSADSWSSPRIIYFINFESSSAVAKTSGFLSGSDYDLTHDLLCQIVLSGGKTLPPEVVGGLDAEQQSEIFKSYNNYLWKTGWQDGSSRSSKHGLYISSLIGIFRELRENGDPRLKEYEEEYNFKNFDMDEYSTNIPLEVLVYLIETQGYEVR